MIAKGQKVHSREENVSMPKMLTADKALHANARTSVSLQNPTVLGVRLWIHRLYVLPIIRRRKPIFLLGCLFLVRAPNGRLQPYLRFPPRGFTFFTAASEPITFFCSIIHPKASIFASISQFCLMGCSCSC